MEDNCFTILCWFLPYISMNRPYVYMCPLHPKRKNDYLAFSFKILFFNCLFSPQNLEVSRNTFFKKRTSSRIDFYSYTRRWFNISRLYWVHCGWIFHKWDIKTNKRKIKAWINFYFVCLRFSWSFTTTLVTSMESAYNNQLSFIASILT